MLKEVHSGGGRVQWLHALSTLCHNRLDMIEIHINFEYPLYDQRYILLLILMLLVPVHMLQLSSHFVLLLKTPKTFLIPIYTIYFPIVLTSALMMEAACSSEMSATQPISTQCQHPKAGSGLNISFSYIYMSLISDGQIVTENTEKYQACQKEIFHRH
jgi:hypothetical protein